MLHYEYGAALLQSEFLLMFSSRSMLVTALQKSCSERLFHLYGEN